MSQNKHFAIYPLALLAGFLLCEWASAQSHRPARQHPATATSAPVIQAQSIAIEPAKHPGPHAKPLSAIPAAAPSLLSVPPEPARVSLASGKLAVTANNSSLSQILLQISKASGMKIDGLQRGGSADPRVFGSYGPGTPLSVLSSLLDGTNYNVLMMGTTPTGAPREMMLSLRGPAGVRAPAVARNVENENPDDAQSADEVTETPDAGDTTDDADSGATVNPNSGSPIPPAGVHETEPIVPPPPPGAPQQQVRSPQQILQELQQMRQQDQQPQ